MTVTDRGLVLTGGVGHPFEDAAPALAECLVRAGYAADITDNIEAAIAGITSNPPRLVAIYALRWSMTTGAKYASLRPQWGFTLSQVGRAALAAYVSNGGSLLVVHTGVICFDGWPEWREIVGGVWAWGRSSHPPRGPAHAQPTGCVHPVTDGIAEFDLDDDEVYADLDFKPGVVPLMTARASGRGERDCPVVWANQYGAGRVVCDTLGHDRRSIETPAHGRLIENAARWLRKAA